MIIVIFYFTVFELIRNVKKVFCLIILIVSGCHNFKEHSGKIITEDEIAKSLLLDSALIRHAGLTTRESVKKFYALRNFSLLWTDSSGMIPAVDSMIHIIRHAKRYGLIPEDYHLYELEDLLIDSVSGDKVSRMDVLLTDSYLALRHHIKHGRLDPKSFHRIDISTKVDDEAIASLKNIHNGSIRIELNLQEPQVQQYQLMKRALEVFLFSDKSDSIQLQRLRGIYLNMERWRWEKQLPDRYVSVNIPAFVLRVVEYDSVLLQSKVIVGKRETPTPVLESVIRSFIIYPYWHAPHSISTKEILPALQADSSYLRKNNFDVLNKLGVIVDPAIIQWKSYDAENFPFILRQREGFENSMGIIKFNFANNYGVYLHDTNSKRLFSRKMRDLSHGCVRMHHAVDFAHYMIREDDIYVSPEDLDQYLSLQQRLKIELRKPIPVKLQYFTCEVEKGVIQFYDDIYKKDSLMMQALYRTNTPVELANQKPSL